MPNGNALVLCQMPFWPKVPPFQMHIKITKICMEISWRMPDDIANIIAELCQRIPIWSIMIKSCISSVCRLGLECKVHWYICAKSKLKQRFTPGLTLPNKLANTKEKFSRQLDFFQFWIVFFGWELRRHPSITLKEIQILNFMLLVRIQRQYTHICSNDERACSKVEWTVRGFLRR